MAAGHHPPTAPWLWVWVWLAIVFSLANTQSPGCHNCSKDFKSLSCSSEKLNSIPREKRYTLKILNNKNVKESLLFYQCHSTAQEVDFSFHQGCNFSSVESVAFKYCPLFNVSFSEALTGLGILPEKIKKLAFENTGTRTDLELESWHLSGLTNLEELRLDRNMFTSLPSDLLEGTPNLKHFFLVRNNMTSLPETLFANTPQLLTITFLNNHFKSLPENLFTNISSLGALVIYGNSLGELNPKLFASIPKLVRLELSFNKLTNLTSETFQYLPKLKKIFLKYNRLESLPKDMFHNCPELQIVHLHNNKLRFIPSELFNNSKNISDFDFHKNLVSSITQGLFQGLENLTLLAMASNSLEGIPNGAFSDLVKLEKIYLQNNPIKTLPPRSFDHQQKVTLIHLANTSLTHLPDNIFKNCKALEKIDMSNNHLSKLKSNFFPHSATVLRNLNLDKNNLSFSEVTRDSRTHVAEEVLVEQFPLSDQVNLSELILSHNRIKVIPHAIRNLKHLKKLNLKNNSIEYLDYYDFLFGSDDAPLSSLTQENHHVQVELAENPLICDCNLYKFSLLLQDKIPEEERDKIQLLVDDKTKVKCSLPDDRSVQKLVMTLDVSTLMCHRNHCHPSCTCATRPYDNMFIMECANQKLQAIPALKQYLPQDNYAVTLDLRNNSITSLKGLQNSDYASLVNLTMPYNYLTFINESILPKRLQALNVQSNSLTYFSPSLIKFLNTTNANLNLGGNPWLCDCKLLDFYLFLRDPHRKLSGSHSIMCSNLKESLLSLSEEELCPTIQKPAVVISIVSCTVILFIIVVLGTVCIYKYQQNIKVWLFTHRMCLWLVAREEAEAAKKYDAFISYATKDENYVNNVLVPGLELGEPKYRVCLHYRDWLPGDYIQNQIDQSIEDSHRTIVILSSNFIENVWADFEFKTAHCKALNENSKKIIVIVLGQVPPQSEMDEELKLYLSTRTYLQSDHPRFWENLRYAMPHPEEFLYKKQTKSKKNERLEMVHTNGVVRS